MKAMDVFSNRDVPALRFQIMRVIRQNGQTVARGVILNDGTRTNIPTATLLSEWTEVRQ